MADESMISVSNLVSADGGGWGLQKTGKRKIKELYPIPGN